MYSNPIHPQVDINRCIKFKSLIHVVLSAILIFAYSSGADDVDRLIRIQLDSIHKRSEIEILAY